MLRFFLRLLSDIPGPIEETPDGSSYCVLGVEVQVPVILKDKDDKLGECDCVNLCKSTSK